MAGGEEPAPFETAGDRFYRGTIVVLHPGRQEGLIRSRSRRDLPFRARDMRVTGTTRGFAALREGLSVGFDLGRTSSGLVVTLIHVTDDEGDQSGSKVR